MIKKWQDWLILAGALGLAISAGAAPIHVTPDGTDPAGGSWAAPTSLTNALAIAAEGTEIWLAQGTYTNTATFTVRTNCTLYGGFTNGMAARNERDWTAYPTVLDGNGQNLRVVTVSGTNVTLDGLVITNSSGAAAGGITKAVAGALTLANCRIAGHTGTQYMMGMGCKFTAGRVLMTNCVVADNRVTGFFGKGFGVYSTGADVEMVDCLFTDNWTTAARGTTGAGLYFMNGTLRVWRTDFINNSGWGNDGGGGGAVYVGGTVAASFSNCVIRGNEIFGTDRSNSKGGGMWLNLAAASTTRVVNCTFTDNVNNYGDGGGIYLDNGALVIKNSIFWENSVNAQYTGRELYRAGGTISVDYCGLTGLTFPHVAGGVTLANCMTNDPLFASATDMHLRSQAGRWEAGAGFVTTDTTFSPCIDAGDDADSIGDEPTDNSNARINLGAYGGTPQASKSPPNPAPLLEDAGAVASWNRAKVSGALTNDSYVTAAVGLCYGTNSVPGDTTNGWDYVYVFDTPRRTGSVFSVFTAALLPSSTYYYRWYAVNGSGSDWTPAAAFGTGATALGGGGDVIHVDATATGAGDGVDWPSAYPSLAEAFLAISGTRSNVWIAGGTYGEGGKITLWQSANLIGGFAGTESAVSDRTLTNAAGVVTNYAVIDGKSTHPGFAITAGNVNLSELVISNCSALTAGAFAKSGSGSLVMSNCRVLDNVSGAYGSGVSLTGGSVLMTNCVVAGNKTMVYFQRGLGIYSSGANLELVDCLVTNNMSTTSGHRAVRGGGLYFENGTLLARRTDIIGNVGYGPQGGGGGGVCLAGTVNATFSNCVLRGNRLIGTGWDNSAGGGMWLNMGAASTTRVVNCTLTDNYNAYGGGGAVYLGGGTLLLKNSILWTNTVAAGYTGSEIFATNAISRATVSYSDLAGTNAPHVVTGGGAVVEYLDGVISADPLFASATDLRLRSKGGRWDPEMSSWVRDAVTSPCIDAGDPADFVGLEPRPNGGVINMGAYGGTIQASLTDVSRGSLILVR